MTYIATIAAVIIIFILLYKVFRFLISLILIAAFLLIAYVTNPSLEEHQMAAKEKAEKENVSLRRKKIDRENFYVFSLTQVTEGEGKAVIGAGAFTKVFIFKKP